MLTGKRWLAASQCIDLQVSAHAECEALESNKLCKVNKLYTTHKELDTKQECIQRLNIVMEIYFDLKNMCLKIIS